MAYTERLDQALVYASALHRHQKRKSSSGDGEIPYISHLLAVASIVMEAGGTEDEAIAALLHDAAEDQGGEACLQEIQARFGDRVAAIVRGCSDAVIDDPKQKPPWRSRKERYIAHLLEGSDDSIYLVSAADKLHNARATLADYHREGERVWTKFNKDAGKDGILWYYDALIAAYQKRANIDPKLAPVLVELQRVISALKRESGAGPE